MENLSTQLSLQPADVIIAKKRGWQVLDHYIAYLGYLNGYDQYTANDLHYGVRLYNNREVNELLKSFEPTRIRKFRGTVWERDQAIERAISQIGARYNLINFNCEHLANYIQFGTSRSNQVNNIGIGVATISALALFIDIFGKDD